MELVKNGHLYSTAQVQREVVTLLYDHMVQVELHLRPLHDPLLHRVLCDQPEHSDLLGLTDAMGPVLSGETQAKTTCNSCYPVACGYKATCTCKCTCTRCIPI